MAVFFILHMHYTFIKMAISLNFCAIVTTSSNEYLLLHVIPPSRKFKLLECVNETYSALSRNNG